MSGRGGLVVGAAATVLLLQGTRVAVACAVFLTERSGAGLPAALALGAALVIGSIARYGAALRRPRAILLPAAMLAATGPGMRVWEAAEVRLALGASAVALWCWMGAELARAEPEGVSLGVVGGLALDLAIRIGLGALDPPLSPGAPALAGTLILGAILLMAGFAVRFGTTEHPGLGVGVAALGPGLAVFQLLTGNPGAAAVRLGADLPAATTALAVGTAVGLAATVSPGERSSPAGRHSHPALVGLVGAAGLWAGWRGGAAGWPSMVIGVAATVMLLARVSVPAHAAPLHVGARAVKAVLAAGMAAQVALLAAYILSSGRSGLLAAAYAILALGALAAPRRSAPSGDARRAFVAVGGSIAGLLLLTCAWRAAWSEPLAGRPVGDRVTVMTYNVQSGFALDGSWSLERTARAIQAERPDIVVLQEVGRGWLSGGGADQVLWLGRRLGMPARFGPSSSDGLWGNAVLSRAPTTRTLRCPLTVERGRERAVLGVELTTTAGSLWVFATHLSAPRAAGAERAAQVRELLELWDGRTPALIAGDLNADPSSPELAALRAAGFTDAGSALPPGAYTSEDRRRIDYILTTSGVSVRNVRVPTARASDHRPVVAELELGR